ncbi:MAG: hypothetical protein OXC81_00965 [Betaproteobacteria bacterium]|nr:hypothetical protein [Betaproteobacteria bacterium]
MLSKTPGVIVTGDRQIGKSTLAQQLSDKFPAHCCEREKSCDWQAMQNADDELDRSKGTFGYCHKRELFSPGDTRPVDIFQGIFLQTRITFSARAALAMTLSKVAIGTEFLFANSR